MDYDIVTATALLMASIVGQEPRAEQEISRPVDRLIEYRAPNIRYVRHSQPTSHGWFSTYGEVHLGEELIYVLLWSDAYGGRWGFMTDSEIRFPRVN